MKPTRQFTTRTVIAIMVAGVTAVALPTTANATSPKPGNATPGTATTVSGSSPLSVAVSRAVKGVGIAAEHRALAAYWTSSRMTSALPDSELPAVKAAARTSPGVGLRTGSVARGTPQRIAAYAPKAAPSVRSTGVSTQASLPGYPVGHPVARTNGKVFFTSFGLNYVCSAAVVNSEGKSEVWTAGHCLTSGGVWNTNWTFVPNYYNGVAPYGYWYSYSMTTTAAWFNNNNDFANDVGASVMYRTGGARIADYFGGQGIAWNQAVSGNYVYAFGYPHAAPFDGCCLYLEQGYTGDGGGGTIYQVNSMTGGSSGGPWLGWFDGNWGYINGHNDFKYTSLPQYMYSPYYGEQVAAVYNAVRNVST